MHPLSYTVTNVCVFRINFMSCGLSATLGLYFRPTTLPSGSAKRKSFSSPLITSNPPKSVSGRCFQ